MPRQPEPAPVLSTTSQHDETYVWWKDRQIGCIFKIVGYPGLDETHPYVCTYYTRLHVRGVKGHYATVQEAADALVDYARKHPVKDPIPPIYTRRVRTILQQEESHEQGD